jgi:hypothetical protein
MLGPALGPTLWGMRRPLLFVATVVVLAGVGCATCEVGGGMASPATGTTTAGTVPEPAGMVGGSGAAVAR